MSNPDSSQYTPTHVSSSSSSFFELNRGHLHRLNPGSASPLLYSRSHTASPLSSPYALSPRRSDPLRTHRLRNIFSASTPSRTLGYTGSQSTRPESESATKWIHSLKSKAQRALEEDLQSDQEFQVLIEAEERRTQKMFEFSSSIVSNDETETVRSQAFETLEKVLLSEKKKRESEIAEATDSVKRQRREDPAAAASPAARPVTSTVTQPSLFNPSRYADSASSYSRKKHSPIRIYEDPQSRSGSEYNSYGDSGRSEDDGEVYADENVDPLVPENEESRSGSEGDLVDEYDEEEIEEEYDEEAEEPEQVMLLGEDEESEAESTKDYQSRSSESADYEENPADSAEREEPVAADTYSEPEEDAGSQNHNLLSTAQSQGESADYEQNPADSAESEELLAADSYSEPEVEIGNRDQPLLSATEYQNIARALAVHNPSVFDTVGPGVIAESTPTFSQEIGGSEVPLDPALFSVSTEDLISQPPVFSEGAEKEEEDEDRVHHNDSGEEMYSDELENASDESMGVYQDDDEGEEEYDETFEDGNSERRRESAFINEDDEAPDSESDEEEYEGETREESEVEEEADDDGPGAQGSEGSSEISDGEKSPEPSRQHLRFTGKTRPSAISLIDSVRYTTSYRGDSDDSEDEGEGDAEEEEMEEGEGDEDEEGYEEYDEEEEEENMQRASIKQAGTAADAITLSSDDEDDVAAPTATGNDAEASSSPTSESGSYSGEESDGNEEDNDRRHAAESSGSMWTPSIPKSGSRTPNDTPLKFSGFEDTFAPADEEESSSSQDEAEDGDVEDQAEDEEGDREIANEELSDYSNGHGDDSDVEEQKVQLEEIRKELEVERAEGELDDAPEDLSAPARSGKDEDEDDEPFIEEETQTPLVHESDSDPDAHYPEEFDDYDTAETQEKGVIETAAEAGVPESLPVGDSAVEETTSGERVNNAR
ncbi:hypothetical protein BZA70DRAFT_288068 [Myxozyma melibiosi]|uniref:Uncharacterized protein n=1 Tax=Myxozyma melibiosi TaxID=54550 RepID=A0ABR1F9R7_9ASCO